MQSVTGEISHRRLEDLAREIGQEGGVRSFGVDTVGLCWVKLYVKDKEAREEIKGLEKKMVEIQELPIDKEELKAAFRENMAQFKRLRLGFLKDHVKQAQRQDVKLLSPANVFATLKGAAGAMIHLNYDLADEEINSIFLELEQGTTQAEKDKQIAAAKKKIADLGEMIEKKLSPKERWFYYSNGERIAYPKGDRWTWFVKTWEEVISRHVGPVDIDGCQLETAEEFAAYGLLNLGEVLKRTPLREGAKR